MKCVFYFKSINSIGGVETFFYNLAKKYDFEIYYKEANPDQKKRLSQYVECRKYKEPIKCDKFFCCYNYDIEVDSPVKKHIIHCDYKNVWFAPFQYKGFEYIGVSQLACDSFKELTGKEAELIYNPCYVEKPKVEKYNDGKLHLISATRLTKEKGLNRMIKLASMLDKKGINYVWEVYTNRRRKPIGNNVIYKDTKFDITKEIAKADYLVQLSDCEAFCYSVVEALSVGTKVICTDLPVFKELNVNNDNAIICNLEMNNIDLNKLTKYEDFTYNLPKDNLGKYLSTNKTYNPKEKIKAKALRKIWFVDENIHCIRGQEIELTKERASYLEAKGYLEV